MRQTYNRRSILGYCSAGVAAAAALLGGAPAAQADTAKFTANLKGADEVPPNQTTGTGSITVTLDTGTNALTWNGTFSGLTGPATAAHFHGPAPAGKNAGVVVWISQKPAEAGTKPPPFTSPFQGTATLTAGQVSDLMAGNWYVNVHTQANPGGEIRGQLVKS